MFRFLLAHVYFQSLHDKPSIGAITDALKDLRKQCSYSDESQKVRVLTHAYEKATETIIGQEQGLRYLAIQILSWIVCATRPLSLLELRHALAVKAGTEEFNEDYIPDIEMMISACAGLVTTDKRSGIIRLVHYTTQEYFENTQSHWFPEAHLMITKTCTTYLSYPKFASGSCESKVEFGQRLDSNPFYDYAAKNWGRHARLTPCSDVLSFLRKHGQLEASTQAVLPNHRDLFRNYYHVPRKITGLHLTSFFGLSKEIALIMDEYDVDATDCCGRTPLLWAAQNGRNDITLLLLKKGANIKSRSELTQRTPLLYAAYNGHEATVRLLLKDGDDIEAEYRGGFTPLLIAVLRGFISMTRLLLKEGANIEAEGKYTGWTPLIIAVHQKNNATVQFLLKEGANIEARDQYGRTSLWRAVHKNSIGIVQLLLEEGANIEAKDKYTKQTPLWVAVKDDSEVIAWLLIKKSANIEAKDADTGRTPLLQAAWNSSEAMVRLLLKEGANIEAMQDNAGWTPLFVAVYEESEEIVKLLLDNGANTEITDQNDGSTLLSEAEKGSKAILQLILEKRANGRVGNRLNRG